MTEPWILDTSPNFDKAFDKLDNSVRRTIVRTMQAIADSGLPYSRGKILTGNLKGLWRYRIGDYRVIADIQDSKMIIMQVDVGHRSDIYD